MPGRFLRVLVVVLALALVGGGSAAAFSVTFDGHVFRYRELPGEHGGFGVYPEPPRAPTFLRVGLHGRLDFASGCREFPLGPGGHPDNVYVRCPVGRVPAGQLRLRLSLFDGDDGVEVHTRLRALIYAGKGDDIVTAVGSRVYGGDGRDEILGGHVYGGRGRDRLTGVWVGGRSVLFGGPGDDDLYSPGRLYGGPGSDYLQEFDRRRTADMLVGGPGQDVLYLEADNRGDVVRVRGGGVDHVHCPAHPDPEDALFVDRTDRLSPTCKDATVLYTERPRYPYP